VKQFSDYFHEDFVHLKENERNIHDLLEDDMVLISGDFYGIQKFIFEGLSTKNASKVIRAKSAFIQLFMTTLSRYICHTLKIDESHILSANAGKFEILSKQIDPSTIQEIQKRVDNYFLSHFFGLSGVGITTTSCNREDFKDPKKYKVLRETMAHNIEAQKFRKFDLEHTQTILDNEPPSSNDTLCKTCNIRKSSQKSDKCDICTMFITLGKTLVSTKQSVSSKNDLAIDLGGFDTIIELDEKIKSYILKGDNDDPIDFAALAKNSCKEIDTGIQSLGILKADVDGMGNYIKKSDIAESFENFDLFSKTLDAFFSIHIPNIMRTKYPDTYTVFAGGDDLFLIGGWDVILELARFIHEEFKRFVLTNELSISFGIIIAKPSTPVSYLAEHSEHALEEAKGLDGKDAITLFRETVKWESYLNTFHKLSKTLDKIDKEDTKTAFLYSIMEFCEMSKKVKYENDIPSTMWKSKLRYSFTRNMDSKYGEILEALDESIHHRPKETKMFLSEFIYKRRD
jgi:CRISPR-associated protein Csm1